MNRIIKGVLFLLLFSFWALPQTANAQIWKKKKNDSKPAVETPAKPTEGVRGATPERKPSTAAPAAQKELEFDFGTAKQGAIVSHTFTLTNKTDVELLIRDIKPACGCTVVENWPKTPIKPGETAQIDARFNSSGKMGKQRKLINVYTDQATNGLIVLQITGEVVNPGLPIR